MNPPDISVVLATRNAAACVRRCLGSLEAQSEVGRAEIVVADCSTDGTDSVIRTAFPAVRLLHFDRPLGQPGLLREGLRHARGRVIAVTDPYCTFPPDWLAKLRQAHESEYTVIGGIVENALDDGLVRWACHFADYGAFMPPAARRVTTLLAGNHVSYKRCVIERQLDSADDGFRKVFFHWDLERQGIRFLFDPELVIRRSCPDTLSGFLRRYFRNGRCFAACRCNRLSLAGRLLRLAGAPALPALLLFQRVREGLGKKEHRRKAIAALPLLAAFAAVWAAGEFTGYLLGPGGLPAESLAAE